jgi:hypothetical protein
MDGLDAGLEAGRYVEGIIEPTVRASRGNIKKISSDAFDVCTSSLRAPRGRIVPAHAHRLAPYVNSPRRPCDSWFGNEDARRHTRAPFRCPAQKPLSAGAFQTPNKGRSWVLSDTSPTSRSDGSKDAREREQPKPQRRGETSKQDSNNNGTFGRKTTSF